MNDKEILNTLVQKITSLDSSLSFDEQSGWISCKKNKKNLIHLRVLRGTVHFAYRYPVGKAIKQKIVPMQYSKNSENRMLSISRKVCESNKTVLRNQSKTSGTPKVKDKSPVASPTSGSAIAPKNAIPLFAIFDYETNIGTRNVSRVFANVPYLTRTGEVKYAGCTVQYYDKLRMYFVKKTFFNEFYKRWGSPLVEYPMSKYGNASKGIRQEMSILYRYGYTVDSNKGLSSNQRRALLSYIIKEKKLTKSKVLCYLNSFINFNGKSRGMANAVAKWESDFKWVHENC